MQVRFSTVEVPPRDRVGFWCDYIAKQAHSITPGESPDPDGFRAEMSGSVVGEFALLDIDSGLERVQRTAADVARDKTEAFFIRRFRRPVNWLRITPAVSARTRHDGKTPVGPWIDPEDCHGTFHPR